jgi:TonB-dependent SusC/RagA subfamily outer membrane receptor
LQPSAGNEIAQANTPQLDAALAGKVSGALVQQMSGTPGGGTSIRIRGLSTLSRSAEPLYILDGVIVDNSSNQLIDLGGYSSNRIADIDPNEIDHIEIVKGAAAAALYGSRANDGVVQIFTKRGTIWRTPHFVPHNVRKRRCGTPPRSEPVASRCKRKSVTRYDYQDQIFQSAPRFSNTLSFSGGDDKTTFFLSGTSENQKGVIRSTDYRRQNLRLNLDRTLTERLKIGVTTAYITSKANVLPNSGLTAGLGVLTSFLFHPNSINFERDPVTGLFPSGPNLANPLEMIANWQAPQSIDRFIGGLTLTAFPFGGLTASYRFGFDGYTQNAQLFIPRGNSAPSVPTGRSVSTTDRARALNSDLDLSLISNVGSSIKLTSGVGMNWQQQLVDIVASRAENLTLLTRVVSGSEQFISEGREDRRTLGFYGQEQIGISDRLFITGSLRTDASSVFGSEVRQQWFPKVGAALNVSDYDFWNAFSGFISTARLRAAYGFSGGQPAGAFDRLSNYILEPNGTRAGIVNATQQGNEQLKPERARELELGTDLALVGGRVGLELTYFDKKVTDLILPKSVDPTSGFLSQLANIGELKNSGIELLLRTVNLNFPSFTWNSTVTYATNDPEVTKVSTGGAFFIPESFNVIRVDAGQPPGHYFGTSYVRDAQGNILTAAGVPITDASGKVTGIPAIGPRIVIGDPNPHAYWSFINDIGIGRMLSVRAQFDGVQGGDIFNFDRRLLETPAFGAGKAYEAELIGQVPKGYFQARAAFSRSTSRTGRG